MVVMEQVMEVRFILNFIIIIFLPSSPPPPPPSFSTGDDIKLEGKRTSLLQDLFSVNSNDDLVEETEEVHHHGKNNGQNQGQNDGGNTDQHPRHNLHYGLHHLHHITTTLHREDKEVLDGCTNGQEGVGGVGREINGHVSSSSSSSSSSSQSISSQISPTNHDQVQ